jgi:hypothetical protein
MNAARAGMLVTVLCAACAGTGTTRPSRELDVITRAQLEHSRAYDAYEAIRLIRPQWLRARAPNEVRREAGAQGGFAPRAADEVQVYRDEQRLGPATSLTQVPISSVQEIRFLNGSDATTRYGIGHTAGALIVTTIRQ